MYYEGFHYVDRSGQYRGYEDDAPVIDEQPSPATPQPVTAKDQGFPSVWLN
jgi:hypothetical protein